MIHVRNCLLSFVNITLCVCFRLEVCDNTLLVEILRPVEKLLKFTFCTVGFLKGSE